MKKLEHTIILLDFYRELLTSKQSQVMRLFYEEDFSLSEIAEQFEITRQAVYDLIKRTESILEHYEDKLSLCEKFNADKEIRERLKTVASRLEVSPDADLWREFWSLATSLS